MLRVGLLYTANSTERHEKFGNEFACWEESSDTTASMPSAEVGLTSRQEATHSAAFSDPNALLNFGQSQFSSI